VDFDPAEVEALHDADDPAIVDDRDMPVTSGFHQPQSLEAVARGGIAVGVGVMTLVSLVRAALSPSTGTRCSCGSVWADLALSPTAATEKR